MIIISDQYMNPRYLTLLSLLIVITSCGKSTQESAEESLIGQWTISKIIENRTNSILNGPTTQEHYQNPEGFFVFTSTMMEYEYKTTSIFISEQIYTLDITKENSGFTQVKVFTINGDQEDFRVRFGDETNDAHENANEISLEQTVNIDGLTVERLIELKRN